MFVAIKVLILCITLISPLCVSFFLISGVGHLFPEFLDTSIGGIFQAVIITISIVTSVKGSTEISLNT